MKRIDSILIANRGEIASRIIRTCKKMGIRSIAVYSDIDKNSLYVKQADLGIYIGGNNPTDSYLNETKILDAAKKTSADAIHPGYGFLSENAAFSRKCLKEDIIFIGPNPIIIEKMGLKAESKKLMLKHNIPIVPGYQGKDQTFKQLNIEADKIGYPILLKASAGGGGKGMKIVYNNKELKESIESAKREALSSFGNDEIIIEKYISSSRHIEFQIFGDKHKNVIHLLERECTIQRRYQKVIEESPSPVLNNKTRKQMGETAIKIAKVLSYDNAGTIEFIYDSQTANYYFLEVNTRLQVEHPVTEEITGLDLVQMQIEVAQGDKLSISQKDVKSNGYAIEARLYAENPNNNFLPETGIIHALNIPNFPGFRLETSIESGSKISIHYDPMIAKLIVWGKDRLSAHRKLLFSLNKLVCLGVKTNQQFLSKIISNTDFSKGDYDTSFIDKKINISELLDHSKICIAANLIASSIYEWKNRQSKRTLMSALPSGWRNNYYSAQTDNFIFNDVKYQVEYKFNNNLFIYTINNITYNVYIHEASEEFLTLEIEKIQYKFKIIKSNNTFHIHNELFGTSNISLEDRFPIKIQEKTKGTYRAPMPSQIVKVLVKTGQKIKNGDSLIILSSMKMENTICADEDGTVEEIYINEGDSIEADTTLIKIID